MPGRADPGRRGREMTTSTEIDTAAAPGRFIPPAGFALGFGLGGFFDGILLHQVLQWHHLLSGLESARADIRFLILTDGLFHLLMYVVTALGLWLLWRAREALAATRGDRSLLVAALLGFGVWHVVDAILSHWLLGIHRIRMDVENPLLWDVLWLAVFGLVPIVGALALRGTSSRGGARLSCAPLVLVGASICAGAWSSLPPRQPDEVAVLFRPDIGPEEAFSAMHSIGGTLVWTDPTQQLWVIDVPDGINPLLLYARGALVVGTGIVPVGCIGWTRA